MEQREERIVLYFQCLDKRIKVNVKRQHKLRKSMQLACNELRFPYEGSLIYKMTFYHNDRQLTETDTPDSVHLMNKDTILMIKRLVEGKF